MAELRPAIHLDGTFYVAEVGDEHKDIYPKLLGRDTWTKEEEVRLRSTYEHGFVNDKLQFMDRWAAWEYAEEHGLLNDLAKSYARDERHAVKDWVGYLNSFDLIGWEEKFMARFRARALAKQAMQSA